MVKRNAIASKLTKTCTQTQKRAFDVAVHWQLPPGKDFCLLSLEKEAALLGKNKWQCEDPRQHDNLEQLAVG